MRSRVAWLPMPFATALVVGAGGWLLLSPPEASTRSVDAHLAPFAATASAPARRYARFPPDSFPDERRVFMDAARASWTYVEREYQPATGLVNSVAGYPYATVWDIASGLAALYSGHRLGFMDDEEYDRRMRRALATLRQAQLYQGVAFNKNYSTRTGRAAGRDDRDQGADDRGYGWSATDLGRLLVWLHVIRTREPQYADEISAVVARLDFWRLVEDGYLWGETVGSRGRVRRYTEGRIPYEQYAAAGFAAFGFEPAKAASLRENALPITVMGVPLVADKRGHDHLTSEPLVLMGLELGWGPDLRELALAMLAVQRERYQRTGQVTVVSEDAIPRAPYYFYYYCVNLEGRWFAIATQNPQARLEGPRWVSAKAAYAWHALVPTEYTRLGVEAVAAARGPRGWGSGVYEQTGRPTGSQNINTAAVILEAALYRLQGGPLAGPPTDAVDTRPSPPRVPPVTGSSDRR